MLKDNYIYSTTQKYIETKDDDRSKIKKLVEIWLTNLTRLKDNYIYLTTWEYIETKDGDTSKIKKLVRSVISNDLKMKAAKLFYFNK